MFMLILLLITNVQCADVKLYSQYDTLLEDKLLIVTKNGLIYNYDLKYQQIRWISELGVTLQSDGLQNGTYYITPYNQGSFLFYDDVFYQIQSEDLDLLFKTCDMFQNSLTYKTESIFFLDIATGNLKQLTQYDIQQLLGQPRLYEKGVLLQITQKYVADADYEDSQSHNSRIQINFLLKYLRGDKTKIIDSNTTQIDKTKNGIYITYNNKSYDLQLDDEVFEVFGYTQDEGIYSINLNKNITQSTSLIVHSLQNSDLQCAINKECQAQMNQNPTGINVYKPSAFKQCLSQFYKVKFEEKINSLTVYDNTNLKPEQCEIQQPENNNSILIILLICLTIGYIPFAFKKQEQPKQQIIEVIKTEPQIQLVYQKQKEIIINKDSLINIGSNGTKLYDGEFQGKQVAVKIIDLNILSQEILEKELSTIILLQQTLNSPLIVKIYFQEKHDNLLYLAIEKCFLNVKDLVKYEISSKISKDEKNFIKQQLSDPKFYQSFLSDCFSGLQLFNERNIQHKGITNENILFDYHLRLKFADLGFSSLDNYYCENHNINQKNQQGKSLLQQIGQLFYYLLTKGDDISKLNLDIKNLQSKFNKYKIKQLEIIDILTKLLLNQHKDNLNFYQKHPYFWNNQRKLIFICEFSDYIETFPQPPGSIPFQDRCIANSIFADNWGTRCAMILKCQIRNYDQTQAKQLIRLIRNVKNHYHQLSEECKILLGPTDETCFSYWNQLFPNLFFTIYQHALENKLDLLSLK